MTTTTLSSKGRFKNLLIGMLRKNIALSCYLGAILFLFFPLQTILNTAHKIETMNNVGQNYFSPKPLSMGMYTEVSLVAIIAILTVAAFAVGLMQCSYLHSKRAVDLYHSLPVTRTELMSANVLTAFITVMVPFLVNYVINLGVVFYRNMRLGSSAQAFSAYAIFWNVFGWCVAIFAILAVVMLVSTQVGSMFENFIFSGELLFAPIIIITINELLCDVFLVGYVSMTNYKYLAASSPIGLMVGLHSELVGITGEGAIESYFFVIATVVWLLLGSAIFYVALKLGRRRRSEIAESPGCKGVLGSVLTLAAVYIGGIGVGALLYGAFDASGEASYILNVFIGAVLVFFFMEAVLNRGFAGIRKTLPFGAVCCALVVVANLAITSGGLGYETRVPATAKVQSVTFDYRGWYDYVSELDASSKHEFTEEYGKKRYNYQNVYQVELKTPEAIELIKQIHLSMASDERDETFYDSRSRMIQYNLGRSTLLREYRGYSDNTRTLLNKLDELPEFQEKTNPLLRIKSETVQSIGLHDSLGFNQHTIPISAQMGTLLEALRQDALANGTRDFAAGSPVLGYIYINTGGEDAGNRNLTENLTSNFSVPVFASSTNTIAAVKAMGKGDILSGADISQVTEMSFNRYSSYDSSEVQVSGVDTYISDKDGSEYIITDTQDAQRIADEGIRFRYASRSYYNYGSSVSYRGSSYYSYGRVYITFYKGDEEGITVELSPDKLPDEVKQAFPEVLERYERDMKAQEARTMGIIG